MHLSFGAEKGVEKVALEGFEEPLLLELVLGSLGQLVEVEVVLELAS